MPRYLSIYGCMYCWHIAVTPIYLYCSHMYTYLGRPCIIGISIAHINGYRGVKQPPKWINVLHPLCRRRSGLGVDKSVPVRAGDETMCTGLRLRLTEWQNMGLTDWAVTNERGRQCIVKTYGVNKSGSCHFVICSWQIKSKIEFIPYWGSLLFHDSCHSIDQCWYLDLMMRGDIESFA